MQAEMKMKISSALMFLSFVSCTGAAGAQVSANALHNRYPAPSREVIEVRPGISITVAYGTGLVACEIQIHPTWAPSFFGKEPETMMDPEVVTGIIDELVPVSQRGKGGPTLFVETGCGKLTIAQYEFVEIQRASRGCVPLQTAREHPAFLRFHWPECAAFEKK